ncbi:MAG: YciI family protein [Burkholderiales bacterium]
MRLIAIFEDTPPMPDVRARLEPAHLAYLRANVGEIVLAGGLRESPGAGYVGGLWILEVASMERAEQLVQADPFFQAEARPYKLLVWGKALPDLQAVL